MSKVVVVMYLSMDGVVGNPAWTDRFWNGEHAKYQHGQLAETRALLLGRRTYEEFAGSWPHRDESEAFTARMNRIPKYVVSNTLETPTWNSIVLDGDPAARVAGLKIEPGQDLLVYGSIDLVGCLIEHALVDELKLFLHPIVLGAGRRLFPDGVPPSAWTLAGTQSFSSGAAVLDYRPVRAG